MARLKTSSVPYEKAFRRMAAIQSIGDNLDLGNGFNVKAYEEAINQTKQAMDEYNTQLSLVDDKLNNFKDKETALKDWNERILVAVAAKYGKASSQYEQAGGKRKTDRKRTVRKAATPASLG